MIKDYILLVLKNLFSRKLRAYLTTIGIFIGIASVVALIGLGEGLRIAISSQFSSLGTDILTVQAAGLSYAGPPGAGAATPLTDDLADKIANVKGVEAAFNRYIESAVVEFNDKQDIGMIGSVPEGENRQVFETSVNLKTDEGRLLKDGDARRVVLGYNFKEDSMFGKGLKVGDNIIIDDKKFQVIGFIEKKGSFIFDNVIFMNENILVDEFKGSSDNSVNIIAVKVKDEKMMDEVKISVEKTLRKERDVKEGEEDFTVETPQSTLDALNSTLFAVQLFFVIIVSISLLVGGIGIMNTMYTSVVERTKDIGIMKSIGAKNSTIFLLFFIESGSLGMVGGIIGITLGLILSYGAAFALRLLLGTDLIRAHVGIWLILGSLLFSFGLGTIFGVLPAYQASKQRPVESLRKAR